jgi:hypothetical protein
MLGERHLECSTARCPFSIPQFFSKTALLLISGWRRAIECCQAAKFPLLLERCAHNQEKIPSCATAHPPLEWKQEMIASTIHGELFSGMFETENT